MTTDARMIGVSQHGNSAESMDLDLGWVRTMEDQGFEARVADVGGPLLSTVTVLSVVEAARINRVVKDRATGKLPGQTYGIQIQTREGVEELLERIGSTHYYSAWIIVETANID